MTSPTLHIVRPGVLTSVQDLGRRGYQRYGIPVCGAMDSVSLRIANILVGNPENSAALEMTAVGPTVEFSEESVIAITGANLEPRLDGTPIPSWKSVGVPRGSTLSFGVPRDGLRAYLAVAGGIDVPPVMDSRSTDLKGGFGGHEGRALADRDALPVGISPHETVPVGVGLPEHLSRQPTYGQRFSIRIVLGPQDDAFTEAGLSALLSSEYAVSVDSDRTGCRLEGPMIEHLDGPDIVSDGTALGSIQVPGGGEPIILLADRGTTGGYAKIATVISPDIGLLAQAMPGAKIRFEKVSVAQAREMLFEQESMVREIKAFVGLDLAGAISVRSAGDDFSVRDADGAPITSPGIESAAISTRRVSATLEGQRFDFDIEVESP